MHMHAASGSTDDADGDASCKQIHNVPLTSHRSMIKAAHDALEELARFRHHKPQAIEIDQHFEKFCPFEVLDRIRKFTALAQGGDEICSRLSSSFRRCRKFVHAESPFLKSQSRPQMRTTLAAGVGASQRPARRHAQPRTGGVPDMADRQAGGQSAGRSGRTRQERRSPVVRWR